MKHFLIITNTSKDIELKVTKTIANILKSQGAAYQLLTGSDLDLTEQSSYDNIDCVIVLGGDGTILKAAGAIVGKKIPIFGVNLGTLGFLAEIEPWDVKRALNSLLLDRYKIEERMMIEGTVKRDGTIIRKSVSLNDIAICRSGFSRIIQLKIFVNNELLDIYEADGVIISTPTGSTGYNLSAGGPVVNPKANLMVVTPISPHSLFSRSIVLSSEDKIIVEVEKIRKTQLEEAFVTFDGQMGIELLKGDIIEIQKAEVTTRLIKMRETSFYKVLRSKIGCKNK